MSRMTLAAALQRLRELPADTPPEIRKEAELDLYDAYHAATPEERERTELDEHETEIVNRTTEEKENPNPKFDPHNTQTRDFILQKGQPKAEPKTEQKEDGSGGGSKNKTSPT